MTALPPDRRAQADANDRAERREQRRDRFRSVLGTIAILLLFALVVVVARAQNGEQTATSNSTTIADQVLTACSRGGDGARELEAIGACGTAREIKQDPVGAQPPPAAVFDREAVRREVAAYLTENPPADGRPPTAAEVDAAVSRVCATIDCQGPAGKDGTNGTDGVDGQDAPPAPDEQVATMVANYCAANNGCRPTDDEVAEAIEIYCSVGERCRGLKGDPSPPPDSYTRTETTTDPITGVQTTTAFSCTRTSPPEQTAPDYDCQEVPQ